jgi:hypothetical protein
MFLYQHTTTPSLATALLHVPATVQDATKFPGQLCLKACPEEGRDGCQCCQHIIFPIHKACSVSSVTCPRAHRTQSCLQQKWSLAGTVCRWQAACGLSMC